MDLYIQIGVIFLFLTALAAFMFVYTEPMDIFVSGIGEVSEEINKTLDDIKSKDVKEFYNNPNVSGVKVETLVKSATANGVAVLLHTKNQQGATVNYGYQLRSVEYGQNGMASYTTASGSSTPFEMKYVAPIKAVVAGDGGTNNTPIGNPIGGGSYYGTGSIGNILLADGSNYPIGAQIRNNGSTTYGVPHIMFAHPLYKVSESKANSLTYFESGMLYTDQELKTNQPTNDNHSYLDAPTSLFYLDKNASFYSTLIVNANGEVVGIFIEEHGIPNNGSILADAMIKSGLISAKY